MAMTPEMSSGSGYYITYQDIGVDLGTVCWVLAASGVTDWHLGMQSGITAAIAK
jgi:hypothetical protein